MLSISTKNVFCTFFALFLLLFGQNICAQPSSADDNIVILTHRDCYEYTASGKNVEKVAVVRKSVSTYKCTKFRTTALFSESYDDYVKINKLKASGEFLPTMKPQYQDLESEYIFHSDAKICYLNIPFSKKGDVCEIYFESTYSDPRYFTNVYFTEKYYTLEKEIEFVIPDWMQVELKEMNFNETISKTESYDARTKKRTIRYSMPNIQAYKKEANAPGNSCVYPHILVLNKYADRNGSRQDYFNTLDYLYKWYFGLANQIEEKDEIIAASAKNITKNCISDMEKVNCIYEWVQKNIRYIAFENGILGFQPAPAYEVLEKKYGDCKGMANLLKRFLKTLGFDARLCWLGTNSIAYDYSMPTLAVDNHMICALFYNNIIYYLDATHAYLPLGNYPENIQGRQVLIENGDSHLLEKIPTQSPDQNREFKKIQLSVKNDTIVGKMEMTFEGESKEWLLSQIHAVQKNSQEEALNALLSKSDNRYRIYNLNLEGERSIDTLGKIQYDMISTSGIQKHGENYYINMDSGKELMNMTMDIEKRVNDWMFDSKIYVEEQTELILNDNMHVKSIPKPFSIQKNGYSFEISYEKTSGKILYSKKIIVHDVLLPKTQFSEWNNDIGLLKKAYFENIVISEK